MVTLDNLTQEIKNLRTAYDTAIGNARINPRQVATQRGLSDIDVNLGVIRAGEFLALSSGLDPQKADAIGTFISAVGKIFGTKSYHIGGVNNGDLKWGANSLTGELEAGAGTVVLTENGLSIWNSTGTQEIARLGNLNGIFGYTTDTQGFALGDSNQYMTYDAINGLRVYGALQTNRETLVADRTYYIDPDGSDSNDGLTAATPFLTIQHAIDVISNYLDIRQYNVTISVAAGIYVTGPIILKNVTGNGEVTITGDTTTPSNVEVQSDTKLFSADNINTIYTIQGFKTRALQHYDSSHGSSIKVGNAVLGDALSGTAYGHFVADWGGNIEIINSYQISGSADYHFRALEGGYIFYDGPASPLLPITVDSSLAIDVFASSVIRSAIYVPYLDFGSPLPTVTGKKYECNILSYIGTNSAGVNYFPGTDAGTDISYGVYD